MANNKYVGEEAVTTIAGYVNKKLTVASSMPISPKNDMIVLYIGATTSSYVHGSIYKYNGTTTSWDIVSAIDTVVQAYADLPSTFGSTDRKMYYVISESCFYLWDGTAWVKKEVDLSIVKNMIAEEFDVSKNYDQYEFVIYEDELYAFDEPHTAGPWDSSEVVSLNVTTVLTMLFNQISQGMVNPEIIADEFDATKSYKQQEIVWHDNELYMFIKDHAAGAWNRSDVLQVDLAEYIKALYDKVNENKADKSDLTNRRYESISANITAASKSWGNANVIPTIPSGYHVTMAHAFSYHMAFTGTCIQYDTVNHLWYVSAYNTANDVRTGAMQIEFIYEKD